MSVFAFRKTRVSLPGQLSQFDGEQTWHRLLRYIAVNSAFPGDITVMTVFPGILYI